MHTTAITLCILFLAVRGLYKMYRYQLTLQNERLLNKRLKGIDVDRKGKPLTKQQKIDRARREERRLEWEKFEENKAA